MAPKRVKSGTVSTPAATAVGNKAWDAGLTSAQFDEASRATVGYSKYILFYKSTFKTGVSRWVRVTGGRVFFSSILKPVLTNTIYRAVIIVTRVLKSNTLSQ